jgi:hypothetical protein
MIDPNNIYHVLPIDDEKPHKEITHFRPVGLPFCDCECKPEHIETENGGMIIVHNSFDGREGVEWANETLSPLTP